MNNRLYAFITDLKNYASEGNIQGLIDMLEQCLTDISPQMIIEILKLAFDYPEILEDNELSAVWNKVIYSAANNEYNEYIFFRLHDLIVSGDNRAVKVLNIFYTALGDELFGGRIGVNNKYRFEMLITTAAAMGDHSSVICTQVF